MSLPDGRRANRGYSDDSLDPARALSVAEAANVAIDR
jgi:hypothetical protein